MRAASDDEFVKVVVVVDKGSNPNDDRYVRIASILSLIHHHGSLFTLHLLHNSYHSVGSGHT